jgi:hypothetical protein
MFYDTGPASDRSLWGGQSWPPHHGAVATDRILNFESFPQAPASGVQMKLALLALVAVPCFATPVIEPQAVDPLSLAEGLYPYLQFLVGTWDTSPYNGPVPEGTGFGFQCCTAQLTGPYGVNEMVLPFTGTVDATEGINDGFFSLEAWYMPPGQAEYYLSVSGGPIPLDPVPEPNPGWLTGGALAAMAGFARVCTTKR